MAQVCVFIKYGTGEGQATASAKFQRLRKCQKSFCNCEMSERGVDRGLHGSLPEKLIHRTSYYILDSWLTAAAL